jgi:hypothetical protein
MGAIIGEEAAFCKLAPDDANRPAGFLQKLEV